MVRSFAHYLGLTVRDAVLHASSLLHAAATGRSGVDDDDDGRVAAEDVSVAAYI